jgi:hypothetical protein
MSSQLAPTAEAKIGNRSEATSRLWRLREANTSRCVRWCALLAATSGFLPTVSKRTSGNERGCGSLFPTVRHPAVYAAPGRTRMAQV